MDCRESTLLAVCIAQDRERVCTDWGGRSSGDKQSESGQARGRRPQLVGWMWVTDEKNKSREESGMLGPVTRERMVLLSEMGRSILNFCLISR